MKRKPFRRTLLNFKSEISTLKKVRISLLDAPKKHNGNVLKNLFSSPSGYLSTDGKLFKNKAEPNKFQALTPKPRYDHNGGECCLMTPHPTCIDNSNSWEKMCLTQLVKGEDFFLFCIETTTFIYLKKISTGRTNNPSRIYKKGYKVTKCWIFKDVLKQLTLISLRR